MIFVFILSESAFMDKNRCGNNFDLDSRARYGPELSKSLNGLAEATGGRAALGPEGAGA